MSVPSLSGRARESLMDKLWSPWRSKYIESFKPGSDKEEGCLFCRIAEENKDKENYLVYRGRESYIVMNLYPYNSGHLMIVPYQHASSLSEFDEATRLDCMNMINLGCDILGKAVYPHGFNIGANIGRVSGAGIDEHVHFHIVPRWNGDTNFMPVLNEVKIISDFMDATYEKLKKALKELKL
jgi:ATP adenylyltransferase